MRQIFSKKKVPMGLKRIFVLTNNKRPEVSVSKVPPNMERVFHLFF